MTWRYLVSAYLILTSAISLAQDVTCNPNNVAFKSGEVVNYRAVYNLGFIWLNAGDVIFTVNDTLFDGIPSYKLKSMGWSLKEYDWFYRVRDTFEVVVGKKDFKPLWFIRNTYEGGFRTFNRYRFDYVNNELNIESFTSDRPYRIVKKDITPCTFDVLSAIYYCRNINFNDYKIGDKIPLSMVVDNDIFNLYIRFLGKEILTTRDGKNYNTIKFSVLLVEGTIFKGGEDMTVWVTDDLNRIPVMVEAKILVGSVKAILTGVKGLAN